MPTTPLSRLLDVSKVLALPHDLVCEMGCASCHDVHGENGDAAKGPEATCLSCHAEAAGPWVFPHRAMEDGCSSCHVPHGSVNRSLLKTSGNGVCLTCHVQTNFPAAGKIPHNRTLQRGRQVPRLPQRGPRLERGRADGAAVPEALRRRR